MFLGIFISLSIFIARGIALNPSFFDSFFNGFPKPFLFPIYVKTGKEDDKVNTSYKLCLILL